MATTLMPSNSSMNLMNASRSQVMLRALDGLERPTIYLAKTRLMQTIWSRSVKMSQMPFLLVILFLSVACSSGRQGTAAPTASFAGQNVQPTTRTYSAPAEIAAAASSSVVVVRTSAQLGAGFVVSPNLVVTSLHIVAGAPDIQVLSNAQVERRVVGVVGWNDQDDLAILKLDEALPDRPLPLSALNDLRVGDPVVAIGHPFGLNETVSTGVVSGFRQDGSVDLLQLSAPVSPGSSGGPVLNEHGEVVGVVRGSLVGGQALNFATPSTRVLALLRFGAGLVDCMAFAQLTGSGGQAQASQDSTAGVGLEAAENAAFWCQKQPTFTDVRVCLSSEASCGRYSNGAACFTQPDAWCVWRAGLAGKRSCVCVASRDECQRNFERIPADAAPTPCFNARSPKEVE